MPKKKRYVLTEARRFKLLKYVIAQIKEDEDREDYTAIDEMFKGITSKQMYDFLDDGRQQTFNSDTEE